MKISQLNHVFECPFSFLETREKARGTISSFEEGQLSTESASRQDQGQFDEAAGG